MGKVENDECESDCDKVASGISEMCRGKGKFPAVTQLITGTGCTSHPVYLPSSVV